MSACKERNWLRRNFEMKVLANNWPIWRGSSKPCCIATHHRHQPSTEKVKQAEKIIIEKSSSWGTRISADASAKGGGKELEKRKGEECCDQVRNTALLIRNRSFGSWLVDGMLRNRRSVITSVFHWFDWCLQEYTGGVSSTFDLFDLLAPLRCLLQPKCLCWNKGIFNITLNTSVKWGRLFVTSTRRQASMILRLSVEHRWMKSFLCNKIAKEVGYRGNRGCSRSSSFNTHAWSDQRIDHQFRSWSLPRCSDASRCSAWRSSAPRRWGRCSSAPSRCPSTGRPCFRQSPGRRCFPASSEALSPTPSPWRVNQDRWRRTRGGRHWSLGSRWGLGSQWF